MLRRTIRTLVEEAATRTGITAAARLRASGSVAILAYHNVVPDNDAGLGDASLHIPLNRFIDHVERIARTHEIVDLHSALTSPPGRRPRAVFTFDDAYRGAVTLALPELRRRGIPATVFVSPALLGNSTTWWDELGALGLLTEARRDEALHHHAGRSERVLATVQRAAPVSLPDSYGIARIDELQHQVRDGITLGSHAWNHEHLPSLTGPELEDVLARSMHWLECAGLPFGRWLALPYGGWSRQVADTALAAGLDAVLLVRGGLLQRRADAAAIPRINVPAGLSTAGLEMRTSGMITR